MAPRLRVLVVDDSPFQRLVIARRLARDPAIQVVGYAEDGEQALTRVHELHPDVVTLDVEMPRADGLTALRRIMAEHPTPVVMLSSLTAEGADVTVRALEMGAVDFLLKPSVANPVPSMPDGSDDLVVKVKTAAAARLTPHWAYPRQVPPRAVTPLPVSRPRRDSSRVVVIGSSTGGPKALMEIFEDLPTGLGVALAVVQHMPAGFTRTLAERLDRASGVRVREAQDGDWLEHGVALLAPGGRHLEIYPGGEVRLSGAPAVNGVRPAADVTMQGAARVYGARSVGVVLTGMGSDGTEGSRAIKRAGGTVLAEHEMSCVVYGMPKSVVDAGHADQVLPLHRMAGAIAALAAGEPARNG